MAAFFSEPMVRLVIMFTACAVFIAIGFYVVMRVRTTVREKEVNSNDLWTNFRELHAQGELSDEEYRNIKSTLATRIQSEIKDSGGEG